GAWLPLVFGRTTIVFSAGPTTYEMTLMVAEPIFSESPRSAIEETPAVGAVTLTLSQRQLIVALAEPLLLREGGGLAEIPTNARAAARLGWAITR
ncbi:hypothetical protein SOO12_14000, partial [Staphylococcus aureus]